MGHDNAHKALGAVDDAAHGTGEQRGRRVVEEILRGGLPQAQPAADGQLFAAGHGKRAAVKRQPGQPNQRRAHHEADACKTEDGRCIGGIDGEHPIPHLDKRQCRPPQNVAEDSHSYSSRRIGEEFIQL